LKAIRGRRPHWNSKAYRPQFSE